MPYISPGMFAFNTSLLENGSPLVTWKELLDDGTIDLMIADLQKRLESKQITLEVTDSAKQFIADNGYDQNFGARPLKRFIKNNVETLVAKKIISGEVESGDTLTVIVKNGDLIIGTGHFI